MSAQRGCHHYHHHPHNHHPYHYPHHQVLNSAVPRSTLLIASINMDKHDSKRQLRLRNGLVTRHAYRFVPFYPVTPWKQGVCPCSRVVPWGTVIFAEIDKQWFLLQCYWPGQGARTTWWHSSSPVEEPVGKVSYCFIYYWWLSITCWFICYWRLSFITTREEG